MPTSRTGLPLLDYAEPRSVLFWPLKAYMKSARWLIGPSPQTPMPKASTSGGATPMPDQNYLSTPAWDPSSHTPGYFDS